MHTKLHTLKNAAANPIRMNVEKCLCNVSSKGFLQPDWNAFSFVHLNPSSWLSQHDGGRLSPVILIQSLKELMPQHWNSVCKNIQLELKAPFSLLSKSVRLRFCSVYGNRRSLYSKVAHKQPPSRAIPTANKIDN